MEDFPNMFRSWKSVFCKKLPILIHNEGIQNVSPATGVSPSTPEYVLRLENMMPIHCLRVHSVTERMKKGKTLFLILCL